MIRKLIIVLTLMVASTAAKAANVTGTIGFASDTDISTLNTGAGVLVRLHLYSDTAGNIFFNSTSKTVILTQADVPVPFTIEVPSEVGGTVVQSFRVGYSCLAQSAALCSNILNGNPRYLGSATYTDNGMVPDSADGKLYTSGTTLTNVDLRLLARPAIKGTISFPAPLTVNESFQVTVANYASLADIPNFFTHTSSRSYLISSGNTEFDYYQPTNLVDGGVYVVEARCNSAPNAPLRCTQFIGQAFYTSTGGVTKPANAEPISFDANLANRDFNVSAGNLLSLTVKLPANELPESSFEVSVKLEKLDAQNSIEVINNKALTFGTSDNSRLYEIRVPSDETEGGYRISYQCLNNDCKNYYPTGFFSSDGAKLDLSDAEIIPYDTALAERELVMLRGQRFSGELSLPSGAIATETTPNFVTATLFDADCKPMTSYQSANQAILIGGSSRSYALNVPLIGQSGYQISYSCAPESACSNSGFAPQGWVGPTSVSESETGATFISTQALPEILDITILDTITPENNPDYTSLGGKCVPSALCMPIKTGSNKLAVVCL